MVSTAIFAPCLVVYLKKTGQDYFNEAIYELAIKSVYSILIYGIIAYCCEVRIKQSFLGKESSDKAFNRWVKIFETFPEGIALVKNNHLLYTNSALKHILDIPNINSKEDIKNEKLKKALMYTNINPYFSHTTETVKGSSTNVW